MTHLWTALKEFAAGDLDKPALLAAAAATCRVSSTSEYRALLEKWSPDFAPEIVEQLLAIAEQGNAVNAEAEASADRTRIAPLYPPREDGAAIAGGAPTVFVASPATVSAGSDTANDHQARTRHADKADGMQSGMKRLAQLADDGRRPRVGTVLNKRFRLEKMLGRGGMSVVYRALDLRKAEAGEVDPYIAVKLLRDEFRVHPIALQALHREAQRGRQLVHPNVLRVYDFDRDGSTAFITMACLRGATLKNVLTKPGFAGLSLADFRPLLSDMAAALTYAHRAGIIHADFKPDNVFVTEGGPAKVFDFGVARAAVASDGAQCESSVFDAAGLSALTPAYASLEMLRGDAADPRDDVYALGCLAYELLSGRHPFDRKDAGQAMRAGLKPERIVGIGRSRWRALNKALALPRDDRLQSVEALNSAFSNTSWIRSPAAAVAALLLLSVVLAGWWAVQPHRPMLRETASVAAPGPGDIVNDSADAAGPDTLLATRPEEKLIAVHSSSSSDNGKRVPVSTRLNLDTKAVMAVALNPVSDASEYPPRLLLAYETRIRAALKNANPIRGKSMPALACRRARDNSELRLLQAHAVVRDSEALGDRNG